MRTRNPNSAVALALLILGALAPGAARGDDRELLKERIGNPYVFLMLDSSGSMNWSTQCTVRQMNTLYDDDGDDETCAVIGATPCVPICTYRCDSGDCATPRNADDPSSKFRQAKEALYQVIGEVAGDVDFGFATYNQDDLHIRMKHWLFHVDPAQPATNFHLLAGNVTFPAPGSEQVFGPLLPIQVSSDPYAADAPPASGNAFGCDRLGFGNNTQTAYRDYEAGCYPSDPADLDDAWELGKVRRLPKLGESWSDTVTEFVRSSGRVYRVRYLPATAMTSPPPATFEVDVEVQECQAGWGNSDLNCIGLGNAVTRRVTYSAPSADEAGFIYWDIGINRAERERGFVGYTASRASHTCRGWEPSAQPVTGAYLDGDGDVDLSNIDRDPFVTASYSLKVPTLTQADSPTVFDPTPGPGVEDPNVDWRFWRGDVLPYSWLTDNVSDIRRRLTGARSPAATNGEAFGQAHHFNDSRNAGDSFLRLDGNASPTFGAPAPLIATGSTPLAGMATFFRHWFSNCGDGGNNCPIAGWSRIAESHDPDWLCRKKYVIFLTDGAETCDNSPGGADYYRQFGSKFPPGFIEGNGNASDACSYVQAMKQDNREDIESIVIAFGVTQQNPKINCLSSDGPPYYVQTKGELVQLLRELFGRFREDSASFASAAVPSVQANIADKIYLSSFTPLNEESVWPGRLDAFLKPLPTDANGLPDRVTRLCTPRGTLEANCFAWDAGDSQDAWDGDLVGYDPQGLLLQAPRPEDIVRGDNATLQIGTGLDQRRVFFGIPDSSSAGKRQYFRYPNAAIPAEQTEFEYVWNLSLAPADDAANLAEISRIVEFTLAEKRGAYDTLGTPTIPGDDQHIQYLMGDIFHANPTILNAPADFDYYTKNLYWGTALCGDADPTTTQGRSNAERMSYAWFSNKHLCRRVMLFAASDDGQLHAFDAGIFRGAGTDPECKLDLPEYLRAIDSNLADTDGLSGEYDLGSGREIFSFIPGAMMPLVQELADATSLTTQYGIDNTPRFADVFIDPLATLSGSVTCPRREWRTVLLGSYREGGPGLFALDITQPDAIDSGAGGNNIPTPLTGNPAYVPSCTAGGADCGPLPFPSLLWEFQDSAGGTPLDEDGVGGPDLAEGWSRPNVARIRVCDGACDAPGEPEDRFVAIFGGGVSESPTSSVADDTGNWLYMVDIETGRTIFKRGGNSVIEGAVPADITLVDVDSDSLVDTLYFGTTAGFLYKLDLGEGPFELGLDGRIADPVDAPGRYNPFKAFTTGGRPIYLEANSVYVTRLRQNALLFGTGNRWNLWEFNEQEARFYAVVDTGWKDGGADGLTFDGLIDPLGCGTCTQPLTEGALQPIDPEAAFDIDNPGPNFLYGNTEDPTRLAGWYFPLEPNEKLITEPFTIAGISFFTIYAPINIEIDGACARGGESKLFIVNTVNATGYTPTDTGFKRYRTASQFTTQPFAESSVTQNEGVPGTNADTWTDDLRTINRELRELQPQTCRFANYTIDIKTIRSDTGIEFIAPVPVCIEGHNWKEY